MDREWKGIFVDHDLDDYALTATEFRVACRIGRLSRGSALCRQSIKSMSADLKLERPTIRRALKVLMGARVIYVPKPGAYRANPPATWADETELEEIRKRILGAHKAKKARGEFKVVEGGG